MFRRWGFFAYRHRRIIPVVLILAVLALYFIAGTKLGDRIDQEGWNDPNAGSTRAAEIEEEVFGRDSSGDVVVLVDAPEGSTVDDPKLADAVGAHLSAVQKAHPNEIAGITSYFDNGAAALATPDKKTAFAAISLAGVDNEVLDNYRAIEDDLADTDLNIEVAGATPIAGALDRGMSGDLKRAELIGLPLVAVLLLVVFGGVIAATMPLLVGVLSIGGSMGILSILATMTQVNPFAQSVVTLLGLGLAIDYGLFMVSRFREELAEGTDIEQAVANTSATAGKTVVFSAAMVAVALSGLLIFPQAFLKSVAYGAMSAVGLAALLSLGVLPALFATLGRNIDRWSVRKAGRSRQEVLGSFWGKVPSWAIRHPRINAAVIIALLMALTAPLFWVRFGGINETYLPPQNETRVAQERFDDLFPTMRTNPVKLVIDDGGDPSVIAPIAQQANSIPGLTERFEVSRPTKDGVTVLSAGVTDPSVNEFVVNRLRDIEAPGNAEIYVGGMPAMEVESIEALFDKLPWMLLYMVLATFVLMALVFGSVILPAKAVIMNTLGLGATLGILTAMFVSGVGSDLLGFTPGPLMSPVLVLIIAIIYGLSTDYEVFLLSRMVEDREMGAPTKHAVWFGTANTGGIITAAAAIMIVVSGAFAFSDIVMMKYIAFGMIAALILDATIIRMLLVPAVMTLLGSDCWWAPAAVKRASYMLGHGTETAPQLELEPARTAALPAGPSADADPAPTTTGKLRVHELRARLEQERPTDEGRI
ncbi:MMPL family transporter [Corynebacterium sp. TAE3-ERU12]|uniref:MMPL family transporter n=1 Tax=Corynebacterium sp. TAE3-ERU12 TaxID=2849491 RepID=UPI001C43BE20|nr:MMPL family transporter [Corynebacterium sp. TAE3-ERU12]MBV7296058.1 MMPL family transporter [Corynebacterium sp. TAE3-ERU12]